MAIDFTPDVEEKGSKIDFTPDVSREEAASFALQQGTAIPSRVINTFTNPAVIAGSEMGRQQSASDRESALAEGLNLSTGIPDRVINTLTSPAVGLAAQAGREQAQKDRAEESARMAALLGGGGAVGLTAKPEEMGKAGEILMKPVEWAMAPIQRDKGPKPSAEILREWAENEKKFRPDLDRLEREQAKVEKSLPSYVHYLEGFNQSLESVVESFRSPIGIATLGIDGLPVAAQKVVSGAFAAQMAAQTPELARELGDEFGKPEAQRDPKKIAKLITDGLVSTGFTVAGALHAGAPEQTPMDIAARALEKQTRKPIISPEQIEARAMRPQARKEITYAEGVRTPEGFINQAGLFPKKGEGDSGKGVEPKAPEQPEPLDKGKEAEAVTPTPPPEPTPAPAEFKPPTRGELLAGWVEYDRLNAELSALKTPEERFASDIPKRLEELKNKLGGKAGKMPDRPVMDPHELVPALRTQDGKIIEGQKGNIHDDIYKAQGEVEGLMLKVDQPQHGFWDGKEFLSRKEAAMALGEKEDLTSQRLIELQKAKETKAPVAEKTIRFKSELTGKIEEGKIVGEDANFWDVESPEGEGVRRYKIKKDTPGVEIVGETKPPVTETKPPEPATVPPVAATPEAPTATALPPKVAQWTSVDIPDIGESADAAKYATRQIAELEGKRNDILKRVGELKKLIMTTRGQGWGYGRKVERIKKSAKKADVTEYQNLMKDLHQVQSAQDSIRMASAKDALAAEIQAYAKVVNDPNRPLPNRIAARVRMFAAEGKPVPEELSKLFTSIAEAEAKKFIPDLLPEEWKDLRNEVERSLMLQHPLDAEFQSNPSFDIYKRRAAKLENVAFYQTPYHAFSNDLKAAIGRFTTRERIPEMYGKPVDKLGAAMFEELRNRIKDETAAINKKAAEDAARVEREAKIEAERQAKLLEEAQKIADSVPKPGSGKPGAPTAKAVKEELISRIKGAIDEVMAKSKTKLVPREGGNINSPEGVDYFAESETSSASSFGNIRKDENGKFVVTANRLGDTKTRLGASFNTLEDAEWFIKAMASDSLGKTTIAVPGDGVFHLVNSGDTLLKLWKKARSIDTFSTEKTPTTSLKGVKPPEGPKPAEPTSPPLADYTEIGHGGETALASYHDTKSGLPPGVKDGGPNFPAELLEASRRLGTLVRSRTTLPPGVGGWYVKRRAAVTQSDRIEVGNILNQLTVAHEMGHDLDDLLFPAQMLGRTQKSLVDRLGGVYTAKELMPELVSVSELMRGKITGSKGHIQYRRSAVELIADFFALYAHDPERARAMAPKFSQGFEDALARNPNAQQVVRELHAGDVQPVAPSTLVGPVGSAAHMPGAVPGRPDAPAIAREKEIAIAAEGLVKGAVRQLEAESQKARIVADRWRKSVSGQQDRNDVGAFVEGTGNLEIPGDTIAAVKARMTPEKQRLAKDYRLAIEYQRQRINEYLKGTSQGEYLQFLEDYLPHFYANSKTPAGRAGMARFIKESPNAKQRTIPTLQEAHEYGLIPITQDPAVLYEHHARLNWRVATNRSLMFALKDLKLPSGEPAIVPAKDAPAGYVISDNPLIQKTYARGTKNGVMVWKGGAAVHPDVWHAVRMIMDRPLSSDLGRAYDAINSITRANAFAFSFFHDITLRAAALGAHAQLSNPLRGLVRFFERDPITGDLKLFQTTTGVGRRLLANEEAVTDAALHGLKFSWNDSQSYQHAARDFLDKAAARWRDIPVLGKSARLARDFQAWRQEWLWKDTHDAFKIAAYQDLTAKALQGAPPGSNPKIVKEKVASLLNDAFGGQEWETKFWMEPKARHAISRFLLAPDWTFSTLRSVPFLSDVASFSRRQLSRAGGRGPAPVPYEGLQGNMSRLRFWGGELAALAIGTIATQYAIYQMFGDKRKGDKPWTWQNETGQNRRIDVTPIMRQLPWHDPKDPTRFYVNLGKRPEELIGWFIHPEENLQSKMARPAVELVRQIFGSEGEFKAQWKRDHETFIESLPLRAKSAAGEFLPFTFQGNQFALSLPYRKGMSKYKAQEAYESVYEIAANPGAFPKVKAWLRGVPSPEGTLTQMVSEITDAAKANGVPTEPIRKRALSAVRGKYYDQFFKAYQKGDQGKMNEAAEALGRLGATKGNIDESTFRRKMLQPHIDQ